MPADLTATATANSVARRGDAAARIGGDDSGQLLRFRDCVADESRFSSNVTADKIVRFQVGGEVLHGRALDGEVAFNHRQGDWLARRQAFEDLWEHGRRLVYGAVNAAGMGTESFGVFCLVVRDPESPPPEALGIFPGNTAERYWNEPAGVDAARAINEATAWSDRADLAVLELGDEVLAAAEAEWMAMTCSSDRWLEVARAGDLPLGAVTEIRFRAELRKRLDDQLAAQLAGATLNRLQANEVAAYRVILGWRRSHGATITDVA